MAADLVMRGQESVLSKEPVQDVLETSNKGHPGATARLMQGRETYGLHGVNQDGTVCVDKERI